MIDYKDKIIKLVKNREEFRREIKSLEEQKKVEINEEVKKIKEKYDRKIDLKKSIIDDETSDLLYYSKMVKDASRFDAKDIIPILSDIVSKVEKKEFVFERIDLDGAICYVIYSGDDKNSITIDTTSDIIYFYGNNVYDYPNLLVDFGKYKYLEDYINSVIEYRLNYAYSIHEITLEELEFLEIDFFNFENGKKLTLN